MSLYFEGLNFYKGAYTDLTVFAPAGSQNGDIMMLVQTGDIGTMDVPAGWIPVLDEGGSVAVGCWYGILGDDITGSSWDLTSINSSAKCVSILRISGTIDDTIEFVTEYESWTDGTRTSYQCPSLALDYPYRPRIYISIGGQEYSGLNWPSFDGNEYGDFLTVNDVQVNSPSAAMSHGLAIAEDNAASDTSLSGGRYYNNAGAISAWRVATASIVLVGPVLQQTDLLSPAQAF